MLYYTFDCDYCGQNTAITDEKEFQEIQEKGYTFCSSCGHSHYYSFHTIANDRIEHNLKVYGSFAAKWLGKEDEMPDPLDMIPSPGENVELEEWQQHLLQCLYDINDDTIDCKRGFRTGLTDLKRSKYSWVEFGFLAFQFKLKRIYKYFHRTWKEFCERELHQSHWYVDKIIKAARVIKDLICAGFKVLPQNEYQCRPLTKFWGDELTENWGKIVDAIKPHLITHDLIKSRFCSREPSDKKWLKVDSEVWEEFEYKAHSRGLNPNHVIEDYLQEWEDDEDENTSNELDDESIEDAPTEELKAWQDDLQTLIEEKDRTDNWFTKLIFWSLANDRIPHFPSVP